MERIMKSQAYAKAKDPTQDFYANQKKIFEINPRHPVVKELLRRIESDQEDPKAYQTANLLFETATLRSGYALQDQVGFAERIENVSFFVGLVEDVRNGFLKNFYWFYDEKLCWMGPYFATIFLGIFAVKHF